MIYQLPPSLFAALEFTSLSMLGWLTAAVLPWLIHRWFRRQHRTTSWAAVDLLLSAMRRRARQVQLQQWLLLAVRTAILVLVALAVAQPMLRQWATASSSQAGVHRILVLDQSYSMGATERGTTRWSRLQSRAEELIASSEGNALSLIGWSDRIENLLGRPTFDQAIAMSAVSELKPTPASADFADAARGMRATIQRAEQEYPQLTQHQVFILTDLGPETWKVDRIRKQELAEIAQLAEVDILNLADSSPGNVALGPITVEPQIPLTQRELVFRAVIRCFGEPPAAEARLELLIDGSVVTEQQVPLARDKDTTAQFPYRFLEAGLKNVEVRLADFGDTLSIDDRSWLVTDVRPKLSVACFAGQRGASDDLVRALAPPQSDRSVTGDITAKSFPISRLGGSDLSHYDAVFLTSVAELTPRELLTLKEYLQRGGGLALLLGPGLNKPLSELLSELLPARIAGLQPPGQYGFDPMQYAHPILAPFRGQTQAGLLGVSISSYVKLQTKEDHPSAAVALAFDTGDPALVVDQHGLGRIAVLALPGALSVRTADSTPWSSFALSPSYLPVMRELFSYLIEPTATNRRNFIAGEPAPISASQDASGAILLLPDGQTRPSQPPVSDRQLATFDHFAQVGIYRIEEGNEVTNVFAVNLDGKDADLRPIKEISLPKPVRAHTTQAAQLSRAGLGEFSFVRPLLAGALALLLLEIGLAWLLGRGWG